MFKKIKVEQLGKQDFDIEEEVKYKILSDFTQLKPQARSQLVRGLGFLIPLEWGIANAMIFYSIRKAKNVQYKIEEEILHAHRGIKFSNDHQALVIWSIEKRDKTRKQ